MKRVTWMLVLVGLVGTTVWGVPVQAQGLPATSVKASKEPGKVDIDVKDAKLQDVLEGLFKLKTDGQTNKIVEPGFYKLFTITLENQDWDAAFQYVLKQAGAKSKRDANGVYIISPIPGQTTGGVGGGANPFGGPNPFGAEGGGGGFPGAGGFPGSGGFPGGMPGAMGGAMGGAGSGFDDSGGFGAGMPGMPGGMDAGPRRGRGGRGGSSGGAFGMGGPGNLGDGSDGGFGGFGSGDNSGQSDSDEERKYVVIPMKHVYAGGLALVLGADNMIPTIYFTTLTQSMGGGGGGLGGGMGGGGLGGGGFGGGGIGF